MMSYKIFKSIICNSCKTSRYFSTTNHALQNVRVKSSNAIPPMMSCWGAPAKLKGGIESLTRHEVSTPFITSPKDVLVKVHAASINPLDILMLDGYGDEVLSLRRCLSKFTNSIDPLSINKPNEDILILGRDFSGTVVSCGNGVSNLRVGQEVMGVVEPHVKMGSHAEFVIAPESQVITVNPDSEMTDIAGIPYAALTAYSSVVITACSGNVEALRNKRVLVAGAAGGVGLMLVQMLAVWGAQVAGVCSSRSFELLNNLGVTELYNYNDKDDVEHLKSEQSFDLVIDGSGVRELPYLDALSPNKGSTYVTLLSPLLLNTDQYGVLPGLAKSAVDLGFTNLQTLNSRKCVKWGYFIPSRKGLEITKKILDNGQLQPVTDIVLPFSETPLAYEHMKSGSHSGKTILSL